jgi:hypothetical protein
MRSFRACIARNTTEADTYPPILPHKTKSGEGLCCKWQTLSRSITELTPVASLSSWERAGALWGKN